MSEPDTGRYASAPDGSPVALYLALPGDEDAALIHGAIPPEAAVLELGCGVGRVSRHLVSLGHHVTGVDNSEAMLTEFARLEGTEPVLDDVATLDLGRTWAAVILASHVINDAAGGVFVASAAKHLTPEGVLLVQRHKPGWIDAVQPFRECRHGAEFELAEVDHLAPGAVAATAIYVLSGHIYRQRFISYEVDDTRLDQIARNAGLVVDAALDDNRSWMKLRRVG